MRLISCSLTTEQVRARTKTQTRRLGWRDLKVGERLRVVEKVQGRTRRCAACEGTGVPDNGWVSECETCNGRGKVTDPLVDLAIVEVTAVRRERLDAISPGDIGAEGFIGWKDEPRKFISMFCDSHNGCTPSTEVTVITWRYVDES